MKDFLDEQQSFLLYLALRAEAVQPVHIRLAPEPGHLPFGVIAVALLRRGDRLLQ